MGAETSPSAPRVACLGGGHGLASGLTALRHLGHTPTAVVTVADDGGSTGILRRELGVIAPGDLRMALLAIARDGAWVDVLAHRFETGALAGHPLGNLLLVALAEQRNGDFVAALDAAARLLGCAGRVLPATIDPVELVARIGGTTVRGQAQITRAGGHVEAVWLEPGEPAGCGPAVSAIADADTVVLGPGSLYTSVVANLLVPDVAAAVREARGQVVYVANLRTQRGETAGLTLAEHVEAVAEHLAPRRLDAVVVHDGPVRREHGTDADPVPLDGEVPAALARDVIRADLAAREADGGPGAAHDPERLATAIAPLLEAATDTGSPGGARLRGDHSGDPGARGEGGARLADDG